MMAYPYDDARIILALQIDHSRVAGYFAAHWGNPQFDRPQPYSSVVLAATEHDSGWWEWEMKPSTLNYKGFPLDYHDGSLKYLGQLRLEFYKNSVDRVLCFDAFHHTPNPARVLAEMGRVLKPGGLAVFSEPGPNHSKTSQSQFEMRNYTVVENDIQMRKIEGWARAAGFDSVRLAVFSAEPFHATIDEYERLLANRSEAWRYLEHH